MRAVCWYGPKDVRVDSVPDPVILNPRDAILRVTSTTICGSDLHLYNGFIPTMRGGDILGHEFMGIVEEVGPEVRNVRPGERVVVAAPIACGRCFYCQRELWSLCDNSNPNAALAEQMWGYPPSAIFGYSHLAGGYAGGQAEYVRVPFADVGMFPVPEGLEDDQVVYAGDVLATAYMAAEFCEIQPGDTVAVWGCGAVGLFAMNSAFLLGAERVIAIDRVPSRLELARGIGAETVDDRDDVVEALKELTGGRGPDACIDAVGMEAHGIGLQGAYDRVMLALRLTTDRVTVLRQAIQACRKGGKLSIAGVYGGFPDKLPIGALMNKGLTVRTGQVHAHRYIPRLLEIIASGRLDPSYVLTHPLPLDEAPRAYRAFNDKEDGWIKVVFKPQEG